MANGYLPPREQVLAIRDAAAALAKAVAEWRSHSALPGFPVEIGGRMALRALFAVERALNPGRLPFDRPTRRVPAIRDWPPEVEVGLAWLRNVADLILERHGLQSLAVASDFDAWRARLDDIPGITFLADEPKALRLAARRLTAATNGDKEPPKPARSAAVKAQGSEPKADIKCPILIISRDRPVYAEGKPVIGRLSAGRFDVLAAVVEAWPGRLDTTELIRKSGHADATKIFTSLKEIEGLGHLIDPAGEKCRGYGLVGTGSSAPQIPPNPQVRRSRKGGPDKAHAKPVQTPVK